MKYDFLVIGGCRHARLPLAPVFADAELKVRIYDINKKK